MSIRRRVLLSEPISQIGIDLLSERADFEIAASADPESLARVVRDFDALIVRSTRVPAAVFETSERLRVLGRHGAGLENIDIAAARQRGVRIVSTPGANAASVAEFVMLAALTLARRPQAASDALRRGELSQDGSLPGAVDRAGYSGRTLVGRKIGIVGFGAIGRQVHMMASGFGMKVAAYDPFVGEFPEGVSRETLDELFRSCDVITLHVPLTDETRFLVDADRLSTMKPDALLINTARAQVVDAAAVALALDEQRLGGYAVDVYDPEPPSADDPLLHHSRILATPHMAAMTDGALEEMARSVVTGVLDALDELKGE